MNHKAYIIHLSSGYNNKYKKGSLVYVLESQSGEKTIIMQNYCNFNTITYYLNRLCSITFISPSRRSISSLRISDWNDVSE